MQINPIDTFKAVKDILDRNNLRISIENGENCVIITTPPIKIPIKIDSIIIKISYGDNYVFTQRFKESLLTDETKIDCLPHLRKIITILFFFDVCLKFSFPYPYAKFILNSEEVDKNIFYKNFCWQSSELEDIIMKAVEGCYTEEELKKLNVFDDYKFISNLFLPQQKG